MMGPDHSYLIINIAADWGHVSIRIRLAAAAWEPHAAAPGLVTAGTMIAWHGMTADAWVAAWLPARLGN